MFEVSKKGSASKYCLYIKINFVPLMNHCAVPQKPVPQKFSCVYGEEEDVQKKETSYARILGPFGPSDSRFAWTIYTTSVNTK